MKTSKRISLKGDELKTFINYLFEEYCIRKNPLVAILYAFGRIKPKCQLVRYNFPEVVLVGKKKNGEKFVQEKYLGRFISIQSKLVVFFPSEDLMVDTSKSFDFFGTLIEASSGFRLYGFKNSLFYAEKNEGEIYYSYGESRDGQGDIFLVDDAMVEKVCALARLEW
jgi:hypothetical protein